MSVQQVRFKPWINGDWRPGKIHRQRITYGLARRSIEPSISSAVRVHDEDDSGWWTVPLVDIHDANDRPLGSDLVLEALEKRRIRNEQNFEFDGTPAMFFAYRLRLRVKSKSRKKALAEPGAVAEFRLVVDVVKRPCNLTRFRARLLDNGDWQWEAKVMSADWVECETPQFDNQTSVDATICKLMSNFG